MFMINDADIIFSGFWSDLQKKRSLTSLFYSQITVYKFSSISNKFNNVHMHVRFKMAKKDASPHPLFSPIWYRIK